MIKKSTETKKSTRRQKIMPNFGWNDVIRQLFDEKED